MHGTRRAEIRNSRRGDPFYEFYEDAVWQITQRRRSAGCFVGAAAYDVCVFESSVPAAPPLIAARVGDDASCRGGSCWKVLDGKGYRFRGGDYRPGGIFMMRLASGAAGDAVIVVQGRGTDLFLDGRLPMTAPVELTAELRAPGGACWRSSFAEPDVIRNDDTLLKARSD